MKQSKIGIVPVGDLRIAHMRLNALAIPDLNTDHLVFVGDAIERINLKNELISDMLKDKNIVSGIKIELFEGEK